MTRFDPRFQKPGVKKPLRRGPKKPALLFWRSRGLSAKVGCYEMEKYGVNGESAAHHKRQTNRIFAPFALLHNMLWVLYKWL